MRTLTRGWIITLVLCQGLLAPAVTSAEPPTQTPEPKVICPAVRYGDIPESYSIRHPRYGGNMFEDRQQAQLAVLGKARKVSKEERQAPTFEVEVEKVLYGSWKDKKLKFTDWGGEEGRHIFSLSADGTAGDKSFKLRYVLDAAEEKAVRVIGEALLDYHALAADCIFVGKEATDTKDRSVFIQVIRSLGGAELAKEQLLETFLGKQNLGRSDESPTRDGPEIYFVQKHEYVPRRFGRKEESKVTYYITNWRQPVEREAEVLDALKRRASYPIVAEMEGDIPIRRREVIFRGSIAAAFDLLGSESSAAQSLGSRKLIHEGRTTRGDVIKAIEKGLDRLTEEARGDHLRLKILIQVLGKICERENDCAAIERLIDSHLAYIAANPTGRPRAKLVRGEDQYTVAEENQVDVNHGLTWLVRELDEKVVQLRFGPRLLKLRSQVKDGWQDEVQLALDVCRVEDQIELSAGLKRMKDVKPLRSDPPLWHGARMLAFSHDGNFLASADYHELSIWSTRDWTLVSRIKQEGHTSRLCFSPDDRFLYVGGWGSESNFPVRFDWRTGKLGRAYDVHKSTPCELVLSADGKGLATAAEHDKFIRITDTATGKVLRSYPTEVADHVLTLSPDGKTLIRVAKIIWKNEDEEFRHGPYKGPYQLNWDVESLDGPAPTIEGLNGKDVWLFSPAGRYLVSVESPPEGKSDNREVTLRVHDGTKGYAVVATRKDARFGSFVVFSADGKRLAVVNGRPGKRYDREGSSHATFLSIPKLEEIGACDMVRDTEFELGSIALSPDGTVFAAGIETDSPYLYDVDAGKQIYPTAGHTGGIRRVFFSADGKTIRTIGWNHDICLWDAATLRLQQRAFLDPRLQVLSIRPTDGRYLFSADGSGKNDVYQVTDADTGKAVCSVKFAPSNRDKFYNSYNNVSFSWLSDREALFCDHTILARFDYLTGKIHKQLTGEVAEHAEWDTDARLTEDGRTLWWIKGDQRARSIASYSMDLTTGKTTTYTPTTAGFGEHGCGLVPGDKYMYVTGPGINILDRRALEVVAEHQFRKVNIHRVQFTADGKRYAVVTGTSDWDDRTVPKLIRIQETFSGKTLGAFQASPYPWAEFRISPDGRRLALINDDGAIELWDLPALAG